VISPTQVSVPLARSGAGPYLRDRGVLSECYPVGTVSAALAPVSQFLYGAGLPLYAGDLVTGATVMVVGAAVGAVPTLVKLALADRLGRVLGATANLASDSGWLSTGPKSYPFTTPVTISDD